MCAVDYVDDLDARWRHALFIHDPIINYLTSAAVAQVVVISQGMRHILITPVNTRQGTSCACKGSVTGHV